MNIHLCELFTVCHASEIQESEVLKCHKQRLMSRNTLWSIPELSTFIQTYLIWFESLRNFHVRPKMLSISFFFFSFIQLSGISEAAVWPGEQPPPCRGVAPVFSCWAFLCTFPVPYEVKRDSSASLLQLPRYSGRFCSAFMEDLNSRIRQLMSQHFACPCIYFPL